ncbi:hypothetical protein SY83_09445 [Paenibacillus swuensis]|uniref:Uncharacterized protein n=1 Tax=Paenibacillus swuensis TaxID=1178515 RepID=A0A172THM2_9BACL|nr:hypothetical protein [Paenibacillus swuensis]ANE46462.1 hypothetical protein SY83_09445 [Paenibacillus swuensis]
MPGLLRTVNGTTTLFATASLKSKQEGILSANIELVTNVSRNVSVIFLNITQNACNLATLKIQSLNRTSSRLTASFGKQVHGVSSANILLQVKNGNIHAKGFINKQSIIPIKLGCGCQTGCSCTGKKKVRFKDGTTLKISIDNSLELALKRLFTKLEREIKKLIPRSRKGATATSDPDCRARCFQIGNSCRAACGIFAVLCTPICLSAQAVCLISCLPT